jgi:double zinc ribbon protein
MSYCSHCGSANKTNSKFCNNCGALSTAPFDVRCATCGSANKLQSAYCSTCGGRLETQPSVHAQKGGTIVPLPYPPRSLAAHEWQVAETKDEAKADAPPLDPQRPGRRMPDRITRLQPAPSSMTSAPPFTATEKQIHRATWLREFHAADEAVRANGELSSENSGDWLANLRAAGIIELEAAREEPGTSASETELIPVPRWFAHIRPPPTVAPPEHSPADNLLGPLPSPAERQTHTQEMRPLIGALRAIGEDISATGAKVERPLEKLAATADLAGGAQTPRVDPHTPTAVSPDISKLYSRMAKSIDEIQARLQMLLRRLAATRAQANPSSMPVDETLEMLPVFVEAVGALPTETAAPLLGSRLEGPEPDLKEWVDEPTAIVEPKPAGVETAPPAAEAVAPELTPGEP